MSKDPIFFYADPQNSRRFFALIDSGNKIYLESSIPLDEAARTFWIEVADLLDKNERGILTKIRAFERRKKMRAVK